MKIVHEEVLVDSLTRAARVHVDAAQAQVRAAILAVHWPPGSGSFTIRSESGKKRGKGNGVSAIRHAFILALCGSNNWRPEQPLDLGNATRPGNVDACLETDSGLVLVEWETGNISSCHRSINKMALALLKGKAISGTVIVPSRALYPFLTDRIANYQELAPYVELWKAVTISTGFLSIVVVEHDATSDTVMKIPKGTDGRSLA